MSRGRLAVTVMVVATLVLVSLSAWLSARVKSPAQVAAELAGPPPSPLTAPVERQVLRRTVVLRGTVRPPAAVEVRVPSRIRDGQVVVTAAAARPGRRVEEGDRLVEVSGRPVFLLRGRMPMYRNLRHGSIGRDVAQLQAALARLGYPSPDAGGRFGAGTEAAVRRFYRARGYEPVTGRPAPPPHGLHPARTGASAPGPPAAQAPRRLVVRWSEIVFVPQAPALVVSAPVAVGQRPARPVLTLAGGAPALEVSPTPEELSLIRRGARIGVEPERGAQGPERFDSTVRSVQAAAADDRAARLETRRPLPASYVGRAVRATVEVARTDGEVLAVPVSAVWSRADGRTYVTVLAPGGVREVVARAGLSVDGMVEVVPAPGALHAGDLVVMAGPARAMTGVRQP